MFDDDQIEAEAERIREEESRGFGLMGRRITRFLVRSLRVILGLVFAGIAFGIGSSALDRLETPFAAQSFAGLVGGLGLAVLAYMFAKWAFDTAFGEGPNHESEHQRLRQKAAERIQTGRAAATQPHQQ